jgi:hypothetical protein
VKRWRIPRWYPWCLFWSNDLFDRMRVTRTACQKCHSNNCSVSLTKLHVAAERALLFLLLERPSSLRSDQIWWLPWNRFHFVQSALLAKVPRCQATLHKRRARSHRRQANSPRRRTRWHRRQVNWIRWRYGWHERLSRWIDLLADLHMLEADAPTLLSK